MNQLLTFGSLEAYVTACCGKSEMTGWRTSRSGDERFTGTRDFQGAVDLALNGWPEGTALIKDTVSQVRERLSGSLSEKQIAEWDVSGADVDVGRYVTGEPENMISFVPDVINAPAKFLHVVVNPGASGGVSREEIARRGAAVVALIDCLEPQGYRVELDCALGVSDRRPARNSHSTIIRLKNAGEPVELDRIAFALAHPAMYRRLQFSLWETLPARERALFRIGETYGYPFNPEVEADLMIGAMQLWNDSKTVEWILAQLSALGIEISNQTN